MKNILMLLRTSGLEYDDRVRKEIGSLIKLGHQVTVLANYTNNKSEKGISEYGVPYKVYSLLTRKLFPSAKFLPLKILEFWLRVYFDTLFKKFDIVWVHEEYMALNILLKPVKGRYIFDMHELPLFLAKSKRMVHLYHIIESKSYKLIVANKDRLNYMVEVGLVKDKSKYEVLNNFPDKVFLELPVSPLPEFATKFVGGAQYVLMQGGGHNTRYPLQVIQAIKEHGKYKAIIVGPIAKEFETVIKRDYQEVVFIAGYIKQLDLTMFIDNAWASIILYGHSSDNNVYCEPNRFYQAINRGVPVIVGNNPPMKRIVDETGVGVVINTDGSQIDDLINGIVRLEENYLSFKQNAEAIKEKYIWEAQIDIISNLL